MRSLTREGEVEEKDIEFSSSFNSNQQREGNMGEIWLLVLFSVSILTGVLWIDEVFLKNFYNLMMMK